MLGGWAERQLNEAHKALDAMGVPDRETRPDSRHSTGENVFSLGVPERIRRLSDVASSLRSALASIVCNGDARSAATAARALGWSDEKRDMERLAAHR